MVVDCSVVTVQEVRFTRPLATFPSTPSALECSEAWCVEEKMSLAGSKAVCEQWCCSFQHEATKNHASKPACEPPACRELS